MATLQIHTPASLRSTPMSRRANPGNLTESGRPYLLAGRNGRTAAIGRTAFVALPKESEDAKITGATRSLDRRLLGLNLRGSRMSVKAEVLTATRIA
ncbi:hypothetical protein BH10ACI4_BH10ACI4_22220 [soil metagenome]